MNKAMREPTLQTIGLGNVGDIFRKGLPVEPGELLGNQVSFVQKHAVERLHPVRPQ